MDVVILFALIAVIAFLAYSIRELSAPSPSTTPYYPKPSVVVEPCGYREVNVDYPAYTTIGGTVAVFPAGGPDGACCQACRETPECSVAVNSAKWGCYLKNASYRSQKVSCADCTALYPSGTPLPIDPRKPPTAAPPPHVPATPPYHPPPPTPTAPPHRRPETRPGCRPVTPPTASPPDCGRFTCADMNPSSCKEHILYEQDVHGLGCKDAIDRIKSQCAVCAKEEGHTGACCAACDLSDHTLCSSPPPPSTPQPTPKPRKPIVGLCLDDFAAESTPTTKLFYWPAPPTNKTYELTGKKIGAIRTYNDTPNTLEWVKLAIANGVLVNYGVHGLNWIATEDSVSEALTKIEKYDAENFLCFNVCNEPALHEPMGDVRKNMKIAVEAVRKWQREHQKFASVKITGALNLNCADLDGNAAWTGETPCDGRYSNPFLSTAMRNVDILKSFDVVSFNVYGAFYAPVSSFLPQPLTCQSGITWGPAFDLNEGASDNWGGSLPQSITQTSVGLKKAGVTAEWMLSEIGWGCSDEADQRSPNGRRYNNSPTMGRFYGNFLNFAHSAESTWKAGGEIVDLPMAYFYFSIANTNKSPFGLWTYYDRAWSPRDWGDAEPCSEAAAGDKYQCMAAAGK